MNEELELLMSEAEDGMKSAIERLKLELTKIRAAVIGITTITTANITLLKNVIRTFLI